MRARGILEQRAPPGDASGVPAQRGHRGQPVRPGAAQQLQQQRFRLVVAMMRECHDGGADSARRIGERVITGVPGQRLEAGAWLAATATRRTAHATRSSAQRSMHACAHCVGVGGQAVVDVDGGDRVAARGRNGGERVEEDDRVAAAGKRDGNGCRRRADAPPGTAARRPAARQSRRSVRAASSSRVAASGWTLRWAASRRRFP